MKPKDLFRENSLKLLKNTINNNSYVLDKKVIKKLYFLIEEYNVKNLLLYIPLKIEVDVWKLLVELRKKCNIYVPFMDDVSFKLVEFRLPLVKKKFHIFEPLISFKKPLRIDMMIVPVVGVDSELRRIGFGKGMYDRFFEKLEYRPKVVFVQREKCFSNERITDIFDIQADFYITPKLNIIRRGFHDYRNWSCVRSNNPWRGFRVFYSKKIKHS